MKITAVTPFSVHPGWGKNWLFVKVETDEGIHGWGEAYTQATATGDRAPIHQIGALPGRPRPVRRSSTSPTWPITTSPSKRGSMDFYSASAASSRRCGTSSARRAASRSTTCSAGPAASKIRVYANGWGDGCRRRTTRAARPPEMVEQGFTALKFDPLPGPWRALIRKEQERQAVDVRRGGARGGRAGRRPAGRGPSPAGADARHPRGAGDRGVRALLVRGAVSAANLDAMAEVRAQIRPPGRHRRGALHQGRVPRGLRAAGGRHHQPGHLQLRRHPGAEGDRGDGRALSGRRLAAQLQQHDDRAGRHGPCLAPVCRTS